MPLTLVQEDGTGKADANSYAAVADADAYYEGHLYASAWNDATAENQAAALVMATRLIDAEYEFNGAKASAAQSLQWPRAKCVDQDRAGGETFLPEDQVPAPLLRATCEMARELLIIDRTAAPAGEGLSAVRNADLSETVYNKRDKRPIIASLTRSMLFKYGSLVSGRSGVVRLARV
jgi:hypothetical protein